MKLRVYMSVLALGWILACSASLCPAEEKQITGLDIQTLRDAMERFYLDYGRLTTVENLDDTFSTTSLPEYQRINDGGGALQLIPGVGLPFRSILDEPYAGGGPPYVGYSSSQSYEGADGDYDEGSLLDGWGHPYYFYSPLGLIEPSSGDLSLRYYGDEFDFYTIISHGPDGEFGGGDDYEAQIFLQVTQTTISSAKIGRFQAKLASGWEIQIKGYVLGTTPGEVMLDGYGLPGEILEWSPSFVRFEPDSIPDAGGVVSLKTYSGLITREIPLIFQEEPLLAASWSFYR